MKTNLLIALLLLIVMGCGMNKNRHIIVDSYKPLFGSLTSIDSVLKYSGSYTSLFAKPIELSQPEYRFHTVNGYKPIITVSAPDSLGVVTVKVDKSRITWVNDSTFTYKSNIN